MMSASRTDDIILNPGFSLLSWSSSKDGIKSYTSPQGGKFVKAIYDVYNLFGKDQTYDQMWTPIRYCSDVIKYQTPVKNCVGNQDAFSGKPVFR